MYSFEATGCWVAVCWLANGMSCEGERCIRGGHGDDGTVLIAATTVCVMVLHLWSERFIYNAEAGYMTACQAAGSQLYCIRTIMTFQTATPALSLDPELTTAILSRSQTQHDLIPSSRGGRRTEGDLHIVTCAFSMLGLYWRFVLVERRPGFRAERG